MILKRPLLILTAKTITKVRKLVRFWRHHSQVEQNLRTIAATHVAGLTGKVVVITGSTKNVGFVLGQAFLRQGARVVFNGRKPADLERARCETEREFAGQVATVCADVAIPEGVEALLNGAVAAFGTVDILINNAGVSGPFGSVAWEVSAQEWRETMSVNLDGPFYSSQAFTRWMIDHKVAGRIINVSSGAAAVPVTKLAPYATSKAALEALTRNFAADLEGTGITVLAIELGSTQSDMTKNNFPLETYLQLPPPEVHIPVFMYAATAEPGAIHGRTLASWRYHDKNTEEAWLCSNLVYGGKLPIKPRQLPPGMAAENVEFLELGENQLGTPDAVRDWLYTQAKNFESHRYPDINYAELREAVAAQLGLSQEALAFGNGSSELIERLLRVFTQPGDIVLSNDPSWFLFDRLCGIYSLENRKVPFVTHAQQKYSHNLDGILAAVTERTRLIYLIHPSNPVGVPILQDEFERFLKKLPPNLLVIVDEAYIQYSDRDDDRILRTVELVKRSSHPILGLRTFSKIYGLAGMRIGFAFASPPMICLLDKLELTFNISSLSAHAARLALDDRAFVESVYQNHKQQKQAIEIFLRGRKLDFVPTQSSMMLAQYPTASADTFYARMRENGVLLPPVNYFGKYFLWPVALPKQNARIMRLIEAM